MKHQHFLRGEDRLTLYNSLVGVLDSVGPEWTHRMTLMDDGNLMIKFERPTGSWPTA